MRTTLMRWLAALGVAVVAVAPVAAQAEKPLTIEGQLKDTDPLDRVRKQSFHKVHEVELTKDQLYLIELRSDDFDTFLRLEDAKGKPLAENDDISEIDQNSRLSFTLNATGKYRLVATSFDGKKTGKYALQVVPLKLAGEAKTIEGKLTKDSPKVQGRYTQIHKVSIQAGRWYLIDLNSKAFIPCLILRDGQGKELAKVQVGAGESNARLLWYADNGGEWLLQALTFGPGTTGAYSVRLRPYTGPKVGLTDRQQLEKEAQRLGNEALTKYQQKKYKEAIQGWEQAVALFEKLSAKQDHPGLMWSVSGLGTALQELGQSAKALTHCERALSICERLHPKQDHPNPAQGLTNLGSVLDALDQPAKALPHLERALAMWERLYSKQDHPDLVSSLNNLGYVLNALGQSAKALPYHERALAMTERLYPKQDHPDLARCLDNLGTDLYSQDQLAKALPYFERALAMWERLYPKQDHPRLASGLNTLGFVLRDLAQPAKSLPHLERALTMYRNLGERAYLGESQAMAYTATLPRTLDAYLSVTRDLPAPASAYLYAWSSKATVTRILQDRHAAVRAGLSKSPQHKILWEELVLVRSQLTFWLLKPSKDVKERDQQLHQLTERKAELERKLGEAFPEGPRRQELAKLGPKDLLKHLPDRTTFIDLIRYTHVEKGGQRQLCYVAFVLSKAGAIQRVELKEAEPIDLAVDLWRQAVNGWPSSFKPDVQRELEDKAAKQAVELRRLVWEPLAKHLAKDTNTVYLSLDGKLARFPFAALPGSKPGTILLQELAITTVPHGPALLERLVYPPQFAKGPGNALIVGGVTYDPTGGKAKNPWHYLKATARERDELKKLAGKHPVLSLSGLEATTDKLRQELPKARYAHLATHGFFEEDDFLAEKKRQSQQLKGYQFSMKGTTELVGQGAQNPLGFAGLVLAGANVPDQAGKDGGRLSGEGIVDLQLEGLRLAVLSACDTGLGDKTGGEAVKNLQLAFHVAGCPDVVASLWQVDDRATAVFMAKFYHELWVKERPPIEALRQAQLMVYLRPDLVAELAGDDRGPPKVHADRRREVLEQGVNAPLAKGIEGQLPARTPTKLWAAFVLSGTGQ